jgi:glycosyltransferase involved in cell wall biosynthesis
MRVMQVVHFFPPDAVAGVERYTQRLSAELVRSGDTVSIVTRRTSAAPRPEMCRERLADGAVLYRFTGGAADEYFFLRHYDRLEQLFAAALVEAAPEVVHFNHVSRLSPRFVHIARRHGAAVVMTLHDYFFACPLAHLTRPTGEFCQGPDGGRECARTCFAHEGSQGLLRWGFRTAYFRHLLGLAQRLIAPSRYLASFFETFGTGPARIHVLPNAVPVDPDARIQSALRSPETPDGLRLAFLGVVTPHKGVHVLLDALKIAGFEGVELLVLGRVPDYERDYARGLRRKAEGISGLQFRMYGSYRPRELDLLLGDVDCVVVPSQLAENNPLVIQEALARGIPVLASRLGGIPEVVKEGINGYTFEHDRPEKLAALLRRLRTEAALLERLRDGARKSPVLTMSQYAERVRDIYVQALADLKQTEPCPDALEEISFLHDELLQLGVG